LYSCGYTFLLLINPLFKFVLFVFLIIADLCLSYVVYVLFLCLIAVYCFSLPMVF
jgi:hypothetical protein